MADWEHAFRALLATRGGALRSYAYLLTGDPATAGDLVQEALTRVFGRRRIGEDIDQLEAYVRRAMLNQYVDGRRRLARWNATRHLLVDMPHHDDDRVAVADEVRRALSTLSPRERACVVLRYYEDLTVAEVAAELGCAEGTVKRHLADARTKLATQLAITEESTP
ncbi:RNA polymerase sigma-70 factor (sigma-E family) [Kribbella sp. VKM Ac-2571]|uniref:RNA polymerase sigma factor n=1 Tax=Kribbella sp. VKM Ac-2571 TaxID=2512222 RepID=UPI00105C2AD0|nr:sigma-70 family RNA polymerase sigma factor [Kribbella sp. VKM Ac-2571]TDO69551.1 RNA polymerase sigma-70 factor (sigma-E family) [Kribbella sp. VKM Ac-2571]